MNKPRSLRRAAYRRVHPRRYREGQLAEQRHQFLDLDPDLRRQAPAGKEVSRG
jgi:hypothetical protein